MGTSSGSDVVLVDDYRQCRTARSSRRQCEAVLLTWASCCRIWLGYVPPERLSHHYPGQLNPSTWLMSAPGLVPATAKTYRDANLQVTVGAVKGTWHQGRHVVTCLIKRA